MKVWEINNSQLSLGLQFEKFSTFSVCHILKCIKPPSDLVKIPGTV